MKFTFDQLFSRWQWLGGTKRSLAKELGVHETTPFYWNRDHGGVIPERYLRKVYEIMSRQ